ncbi:kinase-like domain-containing protein [Kockovaella imperatae]|uniref:non-specific serine/threonine protein kinase n=1 Tax=Kockovaella imperatae TaxID=4999 RepID=A0A1Y1URD7_9TREE|nr:kinase-like domain-containing protein [Kockovaella imperatae]ORX40631.1 kinase-like domain-containing protein [Kockovaella imperatae]
MAIPRRSATACGPSVTFSGGGYADIAELDKYKLVSNIGKGSFGVISKVQRIEDGKEFAMKQLDYSKLTDKDRRQILAEVAILESLKHRNIVQLVQKIKDPKNERIYIVMEYCTSGDLGTMIRKAQKSGQPLNEDRIWNIFLQITLALHHCHWPAERPSSARQSGRTSTAAADNVPRYQVLHRDLKPENIFLSDEFVKLGDFGLSKDMGNSAFTSTYVGTPLYMPPEILAENRYDTKSDIWSLGCVVFEMCALSSPFSTAQTQAELIAMVKSGRLPPLPSSISPELTQVVKAMLTLNPAKRPTTKDLLELSEMKMHRKLFTVQNQAALIVSRREELRQLEERLKARAASLDEKEKHLAAMEASLLARAHELGTREEETRETKRRLNAAAEQLRDHWDRMREENDRTRDSLGMPMLGASDAPSMSRRGSLAPSRPAIEERNSAPVISATGRHSKAAVQSTISAYDDTPSKIPFLSNASGHSGDRPGSRAATPLRRNATKSMGNLGSQYRMDQARHEGTPARQVLPHFGAKQRSSIGSPSDVRMDQDISMASPASSAFMSPVPYMPRPRRSSIAPSAYSTQSSSRPPSTSTSTDSITSADHTENDRRSHESNENVPVVPPTMIPGPASFVYREAATPAKWGAEDPDLPSPFIRRMPTAPARLQQNGDQYVQQGIIPTRQPLGSIDVQPSVGVGIGHITGNKKAPPRSRSGTLHQQVLKSNAARTSEGATGRNRISVAR